MRLARKIQDSLQTELESVRYFTDSAVVLGMILRESATYQEFVGTRVSEIRGEEARQLHAHNKTVADSGKRNPDDPQPAG